MSQYPPPSEGYPGDIRRLVLDQASGYNPGPAYAQSLPPEQFQSPPSVRHSIAYRSGVMADSSGFEDSGYQSMSTSAAPPPQQDGMTPAQAYQAQVLRDDPRLGPLYGEVALGAATPRTFDGRSASAQQLPQQQHVPSTGANASRSQSMARLRSSQQTLPSLPPVDGVEPLDIDDVLEGPREHSIYLKHRLLEGVPQLVHTYYYGLLFLLASFIPRSWLC